MAHSMEKVILFKTIIIPFLSYLRKFPSYTSLLERGLLLILEEDFALMLNNLINWDMMSNAMRETNMFKRTLNLVKI